LNEFLSKRNINDETYNEKEKENKRKRKSEEKEEMIQLLFTVLGLEMALVVVLLFKTPLRKLAILGLDRLKRGRGPVMVKTVAATVLLVFTSSGYSIVKIHDRSNEMGQLTPTDQVLASRHLLEASLMGDLSVYLSLCTCVLNFSPFDRSGWYC
jgi:hypothetical protein